MKSPIVKTIWLFGILSAIISLVLACLGFGIAEFYKIKNESTNRLRSQLDILAYNLESTLLFDDKDAANNILRSLQDDRSIIRVRVLKPDGQLFSSFSRDTQAPGDIKLHKNIVYENKLIGQIEIESIYLELQDRVVTYLLICLVIIILSIPASYFISAPIRQQVSQAVVQLEQQSDRLRLLADLVASTEQRERKRIAALVHDHLQQVLVASKIQMGLALRRFKKQDYESGTLNLNRSEQFLDESIRAAKSLTVELRPPVLYEDGLPAAFQWLANKFKNDHDLEVVLHMEEIPGALSDNLKIMVFESVKELLFNVVKYAQVHQADLYLKYEDGSIITAVKDLGGGFDPKKFEKTASDKGFGLFNIRERLKLLNGTFKIISQPGEGTEVEISIPVQMEPTHTSSEVVLPREAEESTEQKGGNDKAIKILLVDDHKIVREGIANLLKENRAFNVVAQAENGQEAVEKAEAYHPDVIIMDINMPKLNGIEATRVIKNKYANIDVIGLSVQDEANIAESMKKAGAVTLVNKGGDPQQLIQTILNCVKNH